jgi:putative oxidoreductase
VEAKKQNKTPYWIAKSFISFFMVFSAYYSYSHAEDLRKLGFPDYFRIELVTAKIMGGILLLVPQISLRIKEWVYAGFVIAMISAILAHICSGDPISKTLFVAVDLTLIALCIRYVSKIEKLETEKALN